MEQTQPRKKTKGELIKENFSYEILENLGTIYRSDKGWGTFVKKIEWNKDGKIKYDIRRWVREDEKMGKGISFTQEEFFKLGDIINEVRKREENV